MSRGGVGVGGAQRLHFYTTGVERRAVGCCSINGDSHPLEEPHVVVWIDGRTAVGGLGTVIFFCIALGLYRPQHFAEAFSPFLWQWMLLYGTLIVVVGQSSWLIGLKRTSASEASLVEAFNPIGAVAAAYLILAEAPTMAQWVGGAVIVVGLALSLFGTYRRSQEAQPTGETTQMAVASSSFRGM